MIVLTQYKGRKVGVFGLGKAGEATVASLLAGGAEVYAWDDKGGDGGQWTVDKEKQSAHCPLSTVHYSSWPWTELAALILSPGVPLTHPKPHEVVEWAQKYKVPIIGDIELLYTACPSAKYVAITGTNGKSTTTTLIGHILKTAGLKVEVGGNLGTAALSLNPLGADGIYVLELSSYQLDLLKTTRFNVAVFLNVTPDHLDRHGDMQGYIKAKMHIFDRQTPDDVAVIAVEDEYTKSIARDWTGKAKLVKVTAQRELEGKYNLEPISTLTGKHNWQNAAVAYATARACGVAPDVIYKAMQSFTGLRHRLQLVATIDGVRFINDSKATNADATANALAPYRSIYWILGGKSKAGGIESLGEYFSHVAHAFLIGAAEDEFAKTLEGKVPYTRCGTLDVAVRKAAEMAFAAAPLPSPPPQAGEGASCSLSRDSGGGSGRDPVVLLSPACASFDQFKSFEERGDVFCNLVASLPLPSGEGRGEGPSTSENLKGPHPNPLPEGEGTIGATHAL